MTVIRLERRLVEEVKEKLIMNGLFRDNMSLSACIRAGLSDWIYGTPNIEDGREQAIEILAKTGRAPSWHHKGQVAKFAQQYSWSKEDPKADCRLPEAMAASLDQSRAEAELSLKVDVGRPAVDLNGADSNPVFPPFTGDQPLPSQPPWENCKQIDLDEIYKRYPKHPILKDVNENLENEPFLIAVRVAFAHAPLSTHNTGKMMELIENLYKTYSEYTLAVGLPEGLTSETSGPT